MRSIITILLQAVLLLSGTISYSQCFYNKEQTEPITYKLIKIKTTDVEQQLKDFFNIEIEFWESSNTDRFCYYKSDIADAKLTIGEELVKNSILKTPVYAHLVAYYFQTKYNLNLNNNKEKELVADFLSGYYYCYHNITLNWEEINNSIDLRIDKAKELNEVMDAYINLYDNYISDKERLEISLVDKKEAFLKGTYYAMPPEYRMYVKSRVDYGNDIELLFNDIEDKETILTMPNVLMSKPKNTFDSLKFEINKTIKN